MVNGWKVTAIIFIVLFILEGLFLVWAYNLALEDVERENECIYNVCVEEPYYTYYEIERICECYNEDYELTQEVYIK